MIGTLIWGNDASDTKKVTSEEELEAVVDELTEMAKADMPIAVLLRMNSETGLQMIVGLEISALGFYSVTDNPQYVGSLGPWDEDEWIPFHHHREYGEMPKQYFVSINDAREALRQYFRTGSRPSNITWKP